MQGELWWLSPPLAGAQTGQCHRSVPRAAAGDLSPARQLRSALGASPWCAWDQLGDTRPLWGHLPVCLPATK